ncbi:lysosomal-associated transmembrane protein 4A-like [Styela clava]|uniref:lysosomal-associated transmembrane protein 4A-like n=1 Tax=Styela clava TaxID=7725 RepID=UPI0019397D5E|nr:lysosomal-associated transmembrane protein 4A-like [Styela clava]XP_039270674.1 lysosomal-associated transmembrane protein 4A-like [Styela clava]
MRKIFKFHPVFDRNSLTRTKGFVMRSHSKPPTCCFCCHVNAGTIIYALLHLVIALFGIVIATLALSGLINFENGSSLQSTMFSYNSDLTTTQTLWVLFVNGLFFLLIATSAIYGVVKNRAGFILPFFIVQLFDFLCTMVYIGSVVFYWPSFKYKLMQCQHMPEGWKETLMNMDERWLACIVFLFLFVVIFIKCYFISMVYRCYKHITMQVIMQRRGQSEISVVSNAQEKPLSIHIYNPPKYDDIQKVPLVDDAEEYDMGPPPYEQA